MSIFGKMHTLISEERTIGAFKNESDLQSQFVNLSLGKLCPVTIIYPTSTGDFKRVDTLRARDFYVCCYPDQPQFIASHCEDLCINIAKCMHRISYGEPQKCLAEVLCDSYSFHMFDGKLEYLEFSCPISQLLKFAFPIKFNNMLVCVVFIGQYSINSSCDNKLTTYHNSFSNILQKQFPSKAQLYNYISSSIIPDILQFQNNTSRNFELSERNALTQLLFESERQLSKAMLDVLNYESASDSDDYSTNVLAFFWKEVKDSYSSLFKGLGANNVTLYIDDDFRENKASKLLNGIEIYSSFTTNQLNRAAIFDTNQAEILCEQMNSDTISSIMSIRKELLACFRNLLTQDMYHYDYVFLKNEIRLPYAVLITHNNSNENISGTIVEIINKVASNIRFELSSVLTKLSEHATKTILRIYRHEIVHQILALRTSINTLNPDTNLHITQEKIANIFRDCSDSLYELAFMTENIKLFTSSGHTNLYAISELDTFTTVDIFKDIINKHIAMHREMRLSKNIWFEVSGRSEVSHKVCCHPLLLDLLLFNIVSNAVKYAYHGTNVWLDYSIAEEKHQTKKLIIRDYGSAVSSKNDIYRLYYRGPDVANVETGSGIGLYISKRLADMMGINLYHRCRKISNYNVALLEKYMEIHDKSGKANAGFSPEISILKEEVRRLRSERIYSQVVNANLEVNAEELCEDEVLADILLPTYEVSFILEI